MSLQKKNKGILFILFICSLCLIIAISIVELIKYFKKNFTEKTYTIKDTITNNINKFLQNMKFVSNKEGMISGLQRENIKVVCLGDNVYQNQNYVGINESVQEQMTTMLSKHKSSGVVLAQDNAISIV